MKDPNARLQQCVDEALQLATDHKLPPEISRRILKVWDFIHDNPGQSGPRIMAWPELDAIANDAPVLKHAILNIQRNLGERRPR